MKIFTQTYDIARPAEQRFWVAPQSDFAIGVKATLNGAPLSSALTLKDGDTALSADETKIDGFTVFTTHSDGPGSKEYTLSVDGVPETLKLV